MNHTCDNCGQRFGEVDRLNKLLRASEKDRKKLQDLAIWMSGCGYDFTQHSTWIKDRKLLSVPPIYLGK